jgi:hypothetical protein
MNAQQNDSDAVLRHWVFSHPYIANMMRHCTVAKFEVFGSPSDEVRAGFGQMSGMSVEFHPRIVGYLNVAAAAAVEDARR